MLRVYLGGPHEVQSRYGFHTADFTRTAARQLDRYGLVLVSAVPMPASLEHLALRLPRFVGLSAEIGESEDAYLKMLPRTARSDVARLHRKGFGMLVDNDPAWADEFFSRYHEPTILRRHGSEGALIAARYIAEAVRDHGSEFLCVTLGSQRIAALLGRPQPQGYRVDHLGWLDGEPNRVDRAVPAALYWFAAKRARELGLSRVRMGGTPPYIEDGLFQFKTKWNATLDMADTKVGVNRLLLNPSHPNVRRWLKHRSLIAVDANDRFVAYSARHPEDVEMSDLVRKNFACWYKLAEPSEPTSTSTFTRIEAVN